MDLVSPTPMNLLTSPAYMAMPGNVYNTMLQSSQPSQPSAPLTDDQADILMVFFAIWAVAVLIFLWAMVHKFK